MKNKWIMIFNGTFFEMVQNLSHPGDWLRACSGLESSKRCVFSRTKDGAEALPRGPRIRTDADINKFKDTQESAILRTEL